MKRLDEILGNQFILKCSCGMKPTEDKISFGICKYPFYNERLDVIVCERCGQPTFLSLLNPKDVKSGSDTEHALLNGYFQLYNDNLMLSKLEQLRTAHNEESREPTIALEDLFKEEETS